jgi:uncharacterized protein
VSSVTFIVSRAYAESAGTPMKGSITGLVALMELGILVALFYGRAALTRTDGAVTGRSVILSETLRRRGLVLLIGGLVTGFAIGEKNFTKIEPFFVDLCRGILVLFLLEMGMAAAKSLRAFAMVGPCMLAFGIAIPLCNGIIGSCLATLIGLPIGLAFVLAPVAAPASYIAAPVAVRATFAEANPSIYLTSSLGITFPFMLILGVPLIYQITLFW